MPEEGILTIGKKAIKHQIREKDFALKDKSPKKNLETHR